MRVGLAAEDHRGISIETTHTCQKLADRMTEENTPRPKRPWHAGVEGTCSSGDALISILPHPKIQRCVGGGKWARASVH